MSPLQITKIFKNATFQNSPSKVKFLDDIENPTAPIQTGQRSLATEAEEEENSEETAYDTRH